jgi:lysophospholipase L1-like esterase
MGLAVAAAVVVLAEVGARLIFPAPEALLVYDRLLGPTPTPGASVERLSIDVPPVTFRLDVNPLGFRGKRMRTRDKPAGAYRIFFLGASTVENSLLPEERTFAGRVDDALNDRFKGSPPVEVSNAGSPGTTVDFSTVMFFHRVIPLDPDLSIFLLGGNAIVATLEPSWDPRDPGETLKPPSFVDWLSGASRLAGVYESRARLRRLATDNNERWYERHRVERHEHPFTPPRFDVLRGLPWFKASLRRIAVIAKEAHTACAFMTQPGLYKDVMTKEEEAALQGIVTEGQNLETPVLKSTLDAFNEAIRETCREEGVILIDAARDVPRDLAHFIDDYHLTSEGNAAVADSILRALDAAGLPAVNRPGTSAR